MLITTSHYRFWPFKYEAQTAFFKDPVRSSVAALPFKGEAQTALFKDPVRTA